MATLPYTFSVEVVALPGHGRDYQLTPDAETRGRIARALGLESLDLLTAKLVVAPAAGHAVTISGSFEADVVQACVVTLAPVRSHIAESIDRRFVPEAPRSKTKPDDAETEDWVDPNADVPDVLIDGTIDLGDLLAEELSLALDPYPRAPGAAFGGVGSVESASASPFAALATLKAGAATPRRADRKTGPSAKARPGKGKTGR